MRYGCTGMMLATGCFLVAGLLGCFPGKSDEQSEADHPAADAPVLAVVSILPQAYFVDRIGGDWAQSVTLTPPGHSPETYQVTPRQMDLLGRAHIYFRIGMPFETPLASRLEATCPQLMIVDTRAGVSMLTMDGHNHDHSHHDGHDCSDDGNDPHIWLDPQRVHIQARTIAEALIAVAPQHEATFRANLASFSAALDALHGRLDTVLAPVRGATIYVFHPDMGYLADAYGFHQKAIEHEGKSPGARRLYALLDEIKAAKVSAIFVQPQFAVREVATIAETADVEIVLIDNLAYDYIENMEHMARAIAASIQTE